MTQNFKEIKIDKENFIINLLTEPYNYLKFENR